MSSCIVDDKNIQMIDDMFLRPPLVAAPQNEPGAAFDYFDVNARSGKKAIVEAVMDVV